MSATAVTSNAAQMRDLPESLITLANHESLIQESANPALALSLSEGCLAEAA